MTDTKSPSHTLGRSAVRGPRRPLEEVARLAREIYERDIRAQVEADHDGEIVAIDVDSEDWAIGTDLIAATDRLWAQRPDATDVFSQRVGRRAAVSLGGSPLRRAD